MAQANPFDQFDSYTPPAPKPLRGPPPAADKMADEARKQAAEQRAREDQDLQRQKFALDLEKEDRARTKDQGGTVDEKKVATLTTRLAGAFSDINTVKQRNPEAQEPGVVESLRGGLSPYGMLAIPTRGLAGADRRMVYDAEIDALDALLTLGTGAAYNREQLEGQRSAYFPVYGDTPDEIAAKNRRLERVIIAAKANAGPAWANIEPQLQPFLEGLYGRADREDAAAGTAASTNRPPPGGDGSGTRVATGDQRFVEDKEVNDTIFSMWQQGRPYQEIRAYAEARGYRMDPVMNPETAKYARENPGWNPFNPAGRYETLSTRQKLASTPVAGYMSGATNALTAGMSDELYGGVKAAMGGDYETERDKFQGAKEAIADMNPISDVTGNITGGIIGGVGGTSLLGKAGGGVIANAIRANPIKAGIGYGAAYGAGEDNQNRLRGAALGGAGGALGGVAGNYVLAPALRRAANSRIGTAIGETLGDAVNNVRNRAAPKVPEGFDQAVVEAGERQGIPIRRPDAVPAMRNDMATAEASPYGGGLIDNALRQDEELVQGRLAEIGGPGRSMFGESTDYNVGTMGRKVAGDYIERTRLQKNDLYGEANQLAAGQRVEPSKAISVAAQQIAELDGAGRNTNRALIGYIKGLGEDLSKPGGFSITEFQALRSSAKSAIKGDNALTVTDADRRLKMITDAFTEDAADQLPQGAAAKLAEADDFYAKRQTYIDGTLQKLIGTRGNPASAEDVGRRLIAMTKNRADADRLDGFLKEATPDQRSDFAATIAESLGRSGNGEFGLGKLATSIEKTPGNIRRLIFGADGDKALKDLQAIARAKSDTAGGLNTSKSGVVAARQIIWRAMGGMAAGAAPGAASGSATGAIVGGVAVPMMTELVSAIGQRRTARLLLNPDFTKWMRQAPKTATPAEAQAYIGKLADTLNGNPETAVMVSNVIPLFERRLLGSAQQSTTAAAAKDEEEK